MGKTVVLVFVTTCALTACGATEFWSAALALLLLLPACFQPADELSGNGGGGATAGSSGGGRASSTGGGGGTSSTGGGGGTSSTGGGGGASGTGGGGGASGTGGGGASGYWEPCCSPPGDGGRIGVISTCYCPGTSSCNYGWFERCGNNTCAQFTGGLGDAGPCAP